MGIYISSLKRLGVPGNQLHSADEIFDQFFGSDICKFEEFHIAFLDFFSKFNATLPGRHYNPPPLESVKECYEKLQEDPSKDEEDKKRLIIKLLGRHVSISRTNHNNAVLLTGFVAPPAAMLIKKAVPDVIFVSFCTLLAVSAVKIHINKFI